MKYFTNSELTQSATALRLGINNVPTEDIRENLRVLVDCLLDPLREMWGAPLIVTSGYRCAELNRAVGGVTNSHHLKGMAADLVSYANTACENARLMRVLVASGLHWTQAIWECDRRGSTWVHVSYDQAKLRNEVIYLEMRL